MAPGSRGWRDDRQPLEQGWTDRDTALWRACEVAVDLAAGTVPPSFQDIRTTFRPQLSPDERFWAAGPFSLAEMRAGDGTYVRSSGWFVATGAGGLALGAGVAAARAVGNASRRRAAAEAMTPRWTEIDRGTVHLSALGFHLATDRGVWSWTWAAVTAAQMTAPGSVHLLARGADGPTSWLLGSDWAELLFVTWALAEHPRHAQLQSGEWLPPGWLEWDATQQWRTRLTSAVLAP